MSVYQEVLSVTQIYVRGHPCLYVCMRVKRESLLPVSLQTRNEGMIMEEK